MAMEVSFIIQLLAFASFRSLHWYSSSIIALLFFSSGQEVALWVKENFKKELVKLQSFKSKCYKEALEECFLKMDIMMQTPAGQRRLNEL